MTRFTVPVGENGRIVPPREPRRTLSVERGSRVMIEVRDVRLELTTAGRLRREARERHRRPFPDRQRGVVDELLAEKREEVRREGDRERGAGPSTGEEKESTADDTPPRDASE